MSALKISVLLAVLAPCYGDQVSNNNIWKPNDDIIKTFDFLVDNLAHSVDDASNNQKRQFSIIISTNFAYYQSNGNRDTKPVSEGPADVIAAPSRQAFNQILTVLDPAVNLIKKACRPETSQKDCECAIQKAVAEEEIKCPGFSEHMRFRNVTDQLFRRDDYNQFNVAQNQTSVNSKCDADTIKFTNDLKDGKKFKVVMQLLLEWYQDYISGGYPCNLPPVNCEANSIPVLKPQKTRFPSLYLPMLLLYK